MAIAISFGVTGETDAYFIAVNVPGIFWVAIFTTITSVFLPQYVAERRRSPERAELYATESVRVYLILAALVAVLTAIFAKPLVSLAAPLADGSTIALASEFTQIISIGFVFTAYVGVQNALQQANGRFVAPMSVPVVNHSITIAFILLGMYHSDLRLAVIGGVLGWLIQAPIQRLQTRSFYRSVSTIRIRRETLVRTSILSLPVVLSVLLDQFNIFIGTVFASGFGSGAISHLNYASRLTMFAAGLFSWMIAYFIFPKLADNAATSRIEANRELISSSSQLVMILTAPIIVMLVVSSREAIDLVYGHGAFTPADVGETAQLFFFYAFAIIFTSLREIYNRVFFSFGKTKLVFWISAAATLINVLVSWVLSELLGIKGIAIAATLAAVAFLGLQIHLIRVIDARLFARSIAAAFLKVAIAGGVAAAAGWVFHEYISAYGPLVSLVAVSTVILAVFAATIILIYRATGGDLLEIARSVLRASRVHPADGAYDKADL
jgi:putative peptidoglycan lipid II flippase